MMPVVALWIKFPCRPNSRRGKRASRATTLCRLFEPRLRPRLSSGDSDKVGNLPIEREVTIYGLHATALQLIGLEHERLTFYHDGTNRRLTDVHGQVVEALIA